MEAWAQASQGVPQIRVVVADSGYGKTRLVQALYSHLSERFDPENFWPSELSADSNSLRVMPALETVPDSPNMPWLWWGLRWPDPATHNALHTSSRLLESYADPAMGRHVDALRFALDRRRALTSAGLSMGKALFSLIPGAATVADLISATFDVVDALKIGQGYRARVERAEGEEKRALEEIARVIAIFATILESVGKDDAGLPVVLFLDDAQWMDPFTMRALSELWSTAKSQNWRLLVVVTHWEREWLMKGVNQSSRFAHWFHESDLIESNKVDVLRLSRLDARFMERLMDALLPGLHNHQKDHYLDLASGNPRFLNELVLNLKRRPELFESEDLTRALTERGFRNNKFPNIAIEQLEQDRFSGSPKHVRDALGLSSLQGDQFFREFTLDVASKLQSCQVTAGYLDEAESPLALVASMDASRMEFRSKTIFARAETYLKDSDLGEYAEQARLETVMDWVSAGKMSSLRREAALYQVYAGLRSTIGSQRLAEAGPLLKYMAEQMGIARDYRYAADIHQLLDPVIVNLSRRATHSTTELVAEYAHFLEGLVETGYSSLVLLDAPRCFDFAQAVGDVDLMILTLRIHAESLAVAKQPERLLEIVKLLPELEDGASSLDFDRAMLLKAEALYSIGDFDSAVDVYDDVAMAFEKSDKRWGAFKLAAAAGRLRSLIRLGGEGCDKDYVDHVTGFAKSLSTARALAGSISFGAGMGSPPTWVSASVHHDLGLLNLAMAVWRSNTREAKGYLEQAEEHFSDALSRWDDSGSRPDLRARTLWVLAATRLYGEGVTDVADSLDESLGVIAELRGDRHPEVDIVEALIGEHARGSISDELMLKVLDHGWLHLDVDLEGLIATGRPSSDARLSRTH